MTDNSQGQTDAALFFFSLKVLGMSADSPIGKGIFDNRIFSDEILSALIYCIDHEKIKLYGFLILSKQVHLIVSPGEKGLQNTVETIKNATAQRILHLAGKKMASPEGEQTMEQLWLRRFFSQFINTGVTNFWQNDGTSNALQLKVTDSQLEPLDSLLLREKLQSSTHNYLQLGAEAFTKLMLDSLKL